MSRAVGINLGTTYSLIASIDAGRHIIIPNAEGDLKTPSVVAIDQSGKLIVGLPAKRQATTNPENTIFSFKRLMGLKFNDPIVQNDIKMLPYKIVEGHNGDARVIMGGKRYSLPEISAMILQKLKLDAERFLGGEITDAVITVPAYFNDSQRQATKDAGIIAGMNVLSIINEPTASSLAYGLGNKSDEIIAVYDFGGGTLDISILEIGEGTFQVKSTNGDTHLGGDDIDQRIVDWLWQEYKKAVGIDLRQDLIAMQRLRDAAEKAKCELSTVAQTEINLPYIIHDSFLTSDLTMTLTRSKLEQLSIDLIKKSLEPCRQALIDAGLTKNDVTDILLVSSLTRMPMIQNLLREFFGKEPRRMVNQDEVAALGAAIYAGTRKGYVREVLLIDIIPFTLSIETQGGVATPLIPRNTTIPTSMNHILSTAEDNQTSLEINVLQGERPMAADNRSMGRFMLDGIKPAPKGVPRIEITFDIDTNGILNITAQDKGTGKEQRVTIIPSSGLSRKEIERMARDAEVRAKIFKES